MIEKELLKQMLEELKVTSAKTTSKRFKETVSGLYESLMVYGRLTDKQEKLLCEIYKNLKEKTTTNHNQPEEKPCEKCLELGIVQLVENPVALLLCDCPQGIKQIWKLPRITKTLDFVPVPQKQFLPPVKPNTQQQVTRFVSERVAWWKERVKTAELYWVNNPLEPQGEVLRRDPYVD